MAIWQPDTEISDTELVGRRLMEKPGSERGRDDKGRPQLEMNDFYETREGGGLSVDRLGNPNPSQETLKAITTLADEDAQARAPIQIFNGWAAIRVKDFRFTGWVAEIAATPTTHDDGTIANRWHAEVNRDGWREKRLAYSLAITLQHTFTRKGTYVAACRT